MKIRLQSSWEIRRRDCGTVEFSSGTKKQRYAIRVNNPALLSLLDALQEGISPHDIPTEAAKRGLSEATVRSLISGLQERDILLEAEDSPLPPPQNTLYDRQIRFFRSFEREGMSDESLNDNLQNSTVLITGLGGYGSWIALLCARMGIRNIIGVDYDHVEVANLHRQVLYDRRDLGKLKVTACERQLKSVDPQIDFSGHNLRITSASDLTDIMKGVDLVLNPFSYLPMAKAPLHPAGIVAHAALIAEKPCLTFGGSWVGPLTIHKETPCYFCAIKRLELETDLDPDRRNPNIQKRAFAPPIATCCSLAAFEAARFLSKSDTPQTLQGLIQLDCFSFSNSRFLSLDRDPECAFCSYPNPHSLRTT